MNPTIFTPDIARITKFDAREATHLVRDLLYCGALPMRLSDVVISERINVADGGIDAKVIAEATQPNEKAVRSFHFQIKSGDSFEPWQRSAIRKELFGKGPAVKASLGDAVKRCLDVDGVYVLVAVGHDLLPVAHSQAVDHLLEAFADCGHPDARVKVWGANQLALLLRPYPSLSLDVNGVKGGEFETVRQWGSRSDLGGTLALGDAQREFMKRLAGMLRGDAVQHARVIGEPGCGKTRLVLETIRGSEDLAARTIYVSSSAALLRSGPLLTDLINDERAYWTVLVVDECDEDDRATIYNVVKGKERIKLVTIDHGPEESRDESMETIEFPKLDEAQITEILSSHLGATGDLHNWAQWCEGSARTAHIIAKNLKLHPEDILKSPATVKVWDRFVIGYRRADSPDARRLLAEMRHIALFRKFGFRQPVEDEGKFVAKLARRADGSITKAAFSSDVERFAKRRILQGDRTLRIVPHALHVYLWREWWEHYGETEDLIELIEELPPTLLRWFSDMVRYANGSSQAQRAVRKALESPKSPFAKRKFLASDRGSAFLSALAEADPAATLDLLEKTQGKWLPSIEERGGHSQNFVFAIEKIAVWQPHFLRAASLLAKLAVVENARYDNNAAGTLRKLFRVRGAPTQASLHERLPFIESLFAEPGHGGRALAIELCVAMLDTRGGSRIVGVEYQGLLPTIKFWRDTTQEEVYGPWREALAMMARASDPSDARWQRTLSRATVGACFGMFGHPAMAPEVLHAVEAQRSFSGADHEKLVMALLHFFRYPAAEATRATRRRLASLLAELSSGPYERRFARFVEYATHDENHTLSKSGDIVDSPIPAKRVDALALEMLSNPEVAREHLDRAIESDGMRVRDFGAQIGARADSAFRRRVIERAKMLGARNGWRFLPGFLEGTRNVAPNEADELALDLLSEKRPGDWRVGAATWSGATPAMMPRLAILAKKSPPQLFAPIGIQASKSSLTVPDIESLLDRLLRNKAPNAAEVALDISFWWFARGGGRTLSEPLHWRIVTDARLFGDGMRKFQHQWEKFARSFIAAHPSRDIDLLAAVLDPKRALPSSITASDAFSVLADICAARPDEAWDLVSRALESEQRAWLVADWLGGGMRDDGSPAPIEYFAPNQIFDWIDESRTRRLSQALSYVPKTLDGPGGAFTAAFIERYADVDGLTRSLAFLFGNGGMTAGPSSEHHARRREQALKWAAAAPTARVRAFLDAYIESLTADIDRERMQEERS